MFTKILVPLDGTPLAAAALLPATTLARRDKAELVLVGAIATHITEIEAYLTEMAACLNEEGLPVRAILPSELAERGISEEVELAGVDLIVMTTHGSAGVTELLHSDVTWKVLAHTSAPILVCHYAEGEQAQPPVHQLPFMTDAALPILALLDGSPEAERVLPVARDVAQDFGNPLLLLRVGDPLLLAEGAGVQDLAAGGSAAWWLDEAETYLHAKEIELGKAGLRVSDVTALGLPAAVVETTAETYHAGLILVATHGQGWLGQLVLGDVACTLLTECATPLLLVRHAVPVEQYTHAEVTVGVLAE